MGDCLVRLWAPSLVFTSYEVYKHFTGSNENIHLKEFLELNYENEQLEKDFERIFEVRSEVFKALENARNDKLIGKPLEAAISLDLTSEDRKLFDLHIKDEINRFFIVSLARFSELSDSDLIESIKVKVEKAEGVKCPRCWNISMEHDENGLCPRCQKVLKEMANQ